MSEGLFKVYLCQSFTTAYLIADTPHTKKHNKKNRQKQ